jgi:cation transport regulator
MPYNNIDDLPEGVRDNLPKHAQEIYLSAFNNAWDQYKDAADRLADSSREETAHRVAWSAVKKTYAKNKETGKWQLKTRRSKTKIPA